MTFTSSDIPIALVHAHMYDQMQAVGFFKSENRDKLPSEWNCSTAGDKIRVNACVSIMDVTNIDSIGEKFDIKYRLFLIWKVNLEELGFPELAEKTLNSGNFYFMSSDEVDDFVSRYIVPVPTFFNKIQEEETEPATIRCYGGTPHGTALVWNKLFSVTCRERFELQNFPFDVQDLTLDFRLNNPRIWDAFDLTVVSVQFFKSALVQNRMAGIRTRSSTRQPCSSGQQGVSEVQSAEHVLHSKHSCSHVCNIHPCSSGFLDGRLIYCVPHEHMSYFSPHRSRLQVYHSLVIAKSPV